MIKDVFGAQLHVGDRIVHAVVVGSSISWSKGTIIEVFPEKAKQILVRMDERTLGGIEKRLYTRNVVLI